MKLREEEFYEQYHQHGGTTIVPTEIFNELYDDATEEIERLNNIINELEKYINEEYIYDELGMKIFDASKLQDKLQELKGSDKE